jgi:uncharacterized membrane protein
MSVPSEKIPTLWECYKEQLKKPFDIGKRFKDHCGHKFGLVSAFFIFIIMSIVCYSVYKKKQKENEEKDKGKDNNTKTILMLFGVVIIFTGFAYIVSKYNYKLRVTVNNTIGRKLLN